MRIDRQVGADAISARAIAIALAQGVQISETTWDIGTDLTHEHAHRLELVTLAKRFASTFPIRNSAPAVTPCAAKERKSVCNVPSRSCYRMYRNRPTLTADLPVAGTFPATTAWF